MVDDLLIKIDSMDLEELIRVRDSVSVSNGSMETKSIIMKYINVRLGIEIDRDIPSVEFGEFTLGDVDGDI